MSEKNNRSNNIFQNKNLLFLLISGFIFISSFVILIVCMNLNYEKYIDSDISSELILAKQIVNEGRLIFSKNWYYSTEIRVINNQIIYGLLFRITNNYRIVFSISQVIIITIYILCLFVLLKSLDNQKYFFFIATVLLIPWFQTDYFKIVLIQQYYIPHICFSFIVISCFYFYQKESKKITIPLIIGCVLSLLNSLEGPRGIALLSAPLLAVIVLNYIKNKNIKNLIYGLSTFVCSCIGFLINYFYLKKEFNLFSGYYTFSFNFERLAKALWLSLQSLGCSKTDWLSNIIFAINIIFLISYIYLIIKNYKNIDDRIFLIFLFFCLSFCIVILMLCFANLDFTMRYFLPSTVFIIILIPYYLHLFKITFLNKFKEKDFNIKLSFSLIACIGFITISTINYVNEFKSNINLCKNISTELINRNLTKGYASFWLSNNITQLSNGKIDMYSYLGYKKNEGLQIMKWLQLKTHDDFIIKNETFIIFNSDEINSDLYNDGLKYSYEIKIFEGDYQVQFFKDITPLLNSEL